MIRAELNQEDLNRVLKALSRIEAIAIREATQLPRRLAILYSHELIDSILSQNFPGPVYSAYSDRYAFWKNQYGSESGFWNLSRDLVGAIGIEKQGTGWFSGISHFLRDSGGKSWLGKGNKGPSKPIAMYGYVMEYGGDYGEAGVHPGRPLFNPVLDYLLETRKAEAEVRQSMSALRESWT